MTGDTRAGLVWVNMASRMYHEVRNNKVRRVAHQPLEDWSWMLYSLLDPRWTNGGRGWIAEERRRTRS